VERPGPGGSVDGDCCQDPRCVCCMTAPRAPTGSPTVAEFERDSIVICYCGSENVNPNFCEEFVHQLNGVRNARQGQSRPEVATFSTAEIGRANWQVDFKKCLSRARVVVLLEGPDFMSSGFV